MDNKINNSVIRLYFLEQPHSKFIRKMSSLLVWHHILYIKQLPFPQLAFAVPFDIIRQGE